MNENEENNTVVEADLTPANVEESLLVNEEMIEDNLNATQSEENTIDPEILEEIAEIKAAIENNEQSVDVPNTTAGPVLTYRANSAAVGLGRDATEVIASTVFQSNSLGSTANTFTPQNTTQFTTPLIAPTIPVPADTNNAGVTARLTDETNSGLTSDNITNDNTPDIAGMTEAGSTVVITNATGASLGKPTADGLLSKPTDTVLGTGKADENGAYSITLSELADGINIPLTVTATDTAGNIATAVTTVTIDTGITDVAGDVIGITSDITDLTNSRSNDDTITNNSAPNIIGLTEAGASVTLTYTDAQDDEFTTVPVIADENGEYTIAIPVDHKLPQGSNELLVKAVDVAGNEATTTQDVTVDSVVLTALDGDGATAITSDITDGTNSGSNDDTITNNSAPSITGLTEAGASVTLTYMNALGVEYTTVPVIADENGEYTIAIPDTDRLPEGSNELLVKVVDVAGNEATTTQDVTVDSAVLTAPDDDGVTAITSDITDGTNSGSNDDTITNNSAPNITGLTEAGASVTLTYMNALGVEYTTVPVIADENGEYTIAIPVTNILPEGSSELLVKVVDVAGNEATTTQDVTVDSVVLTAPDDDGAAELTSDITDLTNSGSNNDTITNNSAPNITGLTEVGASVTLTYTDAQDDEFTTVPVIADENGEYTIVIPVDHKLPQGSNELLVKAVDVAGNEATTTQDVTVDSVVLTAPDDDGVTAITSDITDGTNSGSNDDTITNNSAPSITGLTEAGASVTLTYMNALGFEYTTVPVIADENGEYTIAIPVANKLPEGSNELLVKVVDVAGNEATTTQDVTVDSVVLTTPDDDGVTAITSDITDGTNSGSNDDTITNNSAPSITGLTEAGASVTLTYMNALGVEYTTVPVIADENGEYTIAIPVTNKLPEGSNELLVKVVDVAGNEATTTQNVTVDPAVNAPTITIAGDSNNDGTYSAAELAVGSADTVTATIEIPSNAIAGDKLTYTVDGGATEVEIELTDENIAAGIPVEVLPEATISATITDTAGNTSGSAMATAFAIDAAQVEITGVAISSSFSEVSLYSGAYLSIGADATLNGSIMTAGYTSIGAKGTLAGDISSGGYTSTGINAIVTGDVLSGDYVTTGASSTISGEIAAVAAITPGAGTSQAVLATNLVLAEQADAKERVADAQKSLKAMAGTPLAESVGNLTLDAGVYVATNISTVAGTTLQLDAQGLNNQTWIFNVSTILALGANTTVEIINPGTEGASGASVIWNSAGYASIGADAEILGTVFAENYITAGANTTIYGPDNTHGGLFSQNNYITLGANATVGSTTASNNASANIVTGTADAEAGSKVTIYYNSGEILTDEAVVEDDGTFTYTLTALEVITLAAEEDKSITASITDNEGIKVESAPFEYNDGLIGSFDDDTLTGTAGIDTITGGIGDDTLEGGDGNDYLIGGAGADTFIWGNGDSGTDHIKDFSLLEGDKLDLSGILNLDLGDTLDEYLNFSSDGTDTTINVFVEGNALTADTPSQKIILDDVDLGNDNVFIINNLYNGDNAGTLIISDVPAIDSSIMVTEIPDSLP